MQYKQTEHLVDNECPQCEVYAGGCIVHRELETGLPARNSNNTNDSAAGGLFPPALPSIQLPWPSLEWLRTDPEARAIAKKLEAKRLELREVQLQKGFGRVAMEPYKQDELVIDTAIEYLTRHEKRYGNAMDWCRDMRASLEEME